LRRWECIRIKKKKSTELNKSARFEFKGAKKKERRQTWNAHDDSKEHQARDWSKVGQNGVTAQPRICHLFFSLRTNPSVSEVVRVVALPNEDL
jgi:hypothetical protein